VIKGLVPLLRNGSRFIVVASAFGTLTSLDPRLHPRFDVGQMSLADVEQVMDDYVYAVETGRAAAEGWPAWINPASKVGQVAAVKVHPAAASLWLECLGLAAGLAVAWRIEW
jgi:carbonyl reductase 1